MFVTLQYIVSQALNFACFTGTASVIIALTDGELNEWQFDTAQREVIWDEEVASMQIFHGCF